MDSPISGTVESPISSAQTDSETLQDMGRELATLSDLRKEVLNLRKEATDLRKEVTDSRKEALDSKNEVLHLRNEILDLNNVVLNLRNEIQGYRALVSFFYKHVFFLLNAFNVVAS